MKRFLSILAAASLVFCAGCSNDEKSKTAAVSAFFSAFNKLCEASSFEADGSITLSGLDLDYQIELDQSDDPEVALKVQSGGSDLASFYIHDEKTYLDFQGTKSQSVASNIGLNPGEKISILNPFLDLSVSERNALFDSYSVKDDTYTFTINPNKLETFLDNYGSVSISKATLKAVITDSELKSMDLDIQGSMAYNGSSDSMTIQFTMNVDSMNQKLDIVFPDDLDSWGK